MTDLATIWGRAEAEAARLSQTNLRTLFAAQSSRFDDFSVGLDDLLVDYSKEKVDAKAMTALFDLARALDVETKRDAMVAGEPINATEGRAVLHMALRGGAGEIVTVDDQDVMPEVNATLDRFLGFAEDVRSGRYRAPNGEAFTDIVNIGIGGSDLGPAMATRALSPDADGPRAHFVSNIDGAHLTDVVEDLNPDTTLAIIASKTFTTQETMMNARAMQSWLGEGAGEKMAAVSTNLEGTAAFGIDASRVFGFWDWVGGRYSIWSAIGLPLAIAIGEKNFRAFLAGARSMDDHFRNAPVESNIPVILALIGVWRRNFMELPTVALTPYDQRLEFFAAYVQQLDMESNGKRRMMSGDLTRGQTGPIIWGEPGTNSQHSFFQLLHQGTDIIPVDFIAARRSRNPLRNHHSIVLANCLAQSRALAFGRTEDEVRAAMSHRPASEVDMLAPHRTFPGDRPSTTILHDALTPFTLGRLIALYEHKVFVQGVIWGVNSYDQWGVELGKQLASELIPIVKGEAGSNDMDGSTRGLLNYLQE